MIYLCEREIGFDAASIGFPSVMGCRAIVLVTGGGLFGYHLNGTLNATKLAAFAAFVNGHVNGNGTGRRCLYAASVGAGSQADHDELRDVAQAVNYGGAIYWANLPGGGSSFVHYQDINHNTCVIGSRTWVDANDGVAGNKVAYVGGANRAIANGAAPGSMYNNVSFVGLVTRYPNAI